MDSREAAVSSQIFKTYEAVLANPSRAQIMAELATQLADSGTRRELTSGSADVASTGGPASLSTLLCPLMLAADGLLVAKVGVAGRPAGGIDVLGTIAGYRTRLSPSEFEGVLERSGYAHVEADSNWAPADAALFRYRQQHGTQANPALAIASLLAKKLAAGVEFVGLDARIGPHGNFGESPREGVVNAELYCEAATLLGLRPFVFLTNATVPYQPFVGRGEALYAMNLVVSGTSTKQTAVTEIAWLARHAELCASIASAVGVAARTGPVRGVPGTSPSEMWGPEASPISLASVMEANLSAQGSSTDAFTYRLMQVDKDPRRDIHASIAGYVQYDLAAIRDLLVRLNTGHKGSHRAESARTQSSYPDIAGASLHVPSGTYVERGDCVITIRDAVGRPLEKKTELFRMLKTPGSPDNELIAVI